MAGGKKRELCSLGEYQRLLERFETFNDGFILPDLFLVMRIDAHRYGPQWETIPDGEYPFGQQIFDGFLSAARYLMCSGFRVTFSFISGDEISLFFDPIEGVNQRRRNKFVSLISSMGAVSFQKEFGAPVAYHAKLSELPSRNHVIDYFLWQRKVSTRNFFSRALGSIFAAQGLSPQQINARIGGLTKEQQIALAEESGIPFDSIDPWKRLGAAMWWERESGTGRYVLVQSKYLPDDDLAFLSWIEKRVDGESYLPEREGVPVDVIELKPGAEPGPAASSHSPSMRTPTRPAAPLPVRSAKAPFRIGASAPPNFGTRRRK